MRIYSLCLLLFCVSLSYANPLRGTVEFVLDGDTVSFRGDEGALLRIRLAYIDAPECSQPYGRNARQELMQAVAQQQVTVNVLGVDQYQRQIGQLWVGTRDINLMLLHVGAAWLDRFALARLGRTSSQGINYKEAESSARHAARGLWQEPAPIAPWIYRQQHQNQPPTKCY